MESYDESLARILGKRGIVYEPLAKREGRDAYKEWHQRFTPESYRTGRPWPRGLIKRLSRDVCAERGRVWADSEALDLYRVQRPDRYYILSGDWSGQVVCAAGPKLPEADALNKLASLVVQAADIALCDASFGWTTIFRSDNRTFFLLPIMPREESTGE